MEESRKPISLEELSGHSKPVDLWISIQGKVDDVTGGSTLLLHLAGQDVTDVFVAYHPATAWRHLDCFFTGYHLADHTVFSAVVLPDQPSFVPAPANASVQEPTTRTSGSE